MSLRKSVTQVAGLPGVHVEVVEFDAKLAATACKWLQKLAEQIYLGRNVTGIKLRRHEFITGTKRSVERALIYADRRRPAFWLAG